jgi:hypothetical protein
MSVLKVRNGGWWFSENDEDSNISLEFTISKQCWHTITNFNDIKHVTSIEWNLNPNNQTYNIKLNLMSTDKSHPETNQMINDIVTYFNEYMAHFHTITIYNFFGNIDLTPLSILPKCIILQSCIFEQINIPTPNNINKLELP